MHDSAHRSLRSWARIHKPRYEYGHVLPDPRITFGIEQEYEGLGRDATQTLHRLGIASNARPFPPQNLDIQRRPGKWSMEMDWNRGWINQIHGEAISPVMTDT